MQYIHRQVETEIHKAIKRNKSVLLLGPRQTGKTTLIKRLELDLFISMIIPSVRQSYERSPELLLGEIQGLKKKMPTVVLDEVQKVPDILDVVQYAIDNSLANFILTGSSARKLRRWGDVNLLPGRVVSFKLDPFNFKELSEKNISDFIMYGSLPGIYSVKNKNDKERDLEAYVTTYLEEEVRSEALIRNIGPFARFLELSASESGSIINLRKLSQEIGVSHSTIASYYQILEDCLIIERIESISESKTRKKLTRSDKYLFFDMGVRRVSAREGVKPSKESLGKLFEQFIGLEFIRLTRNLHKKIKLKFWRDPDGPEVDWVLDTGNLFIPIEVKWTNLPKKNDVKHLKVFLSEYKNSKCGYIICQCQRRIKLDENIYAIPWQELDSLI